MCVCALGPTRTSRMRVRMVRSPRVSRKGKFFFSGKDDRYTPSSTCGMRVRWAVSRGAQHGHADTMCVCVCVCHHGEVFRGVHFFLRVVEDPLPGHSATPPALESLYLMGLLREEARAPRSGSGFHPLRGAQIALRRDKDIKMARSYDSSSALCLSLSLPLSLRLLVRSLVLHLHRAPVASLSLSSCPSLVVVVGGVQALPAIRQCPRLTFARIVAL